MCPIYYRGAVHCLKLSPNLRKEKRNIRKALLENDKRKWRTLQIEKLLTFLEMVKDPQKSLKNHSEEETPLKNVNLSLSPLLVSLIERIKT